MSGGGGGDGGGDGDGDCTRVPQSTQSVPKAHSENSEPGPPSSHSPSAANEGKAGQVFRHCDGGDKGGVGGCCGCGSCGGGGDGGGGDGGGDGDCTRVPQSTQSVPQAQWLCSEPGPPSSQSPSAANEGWPTHVFRHCDAAGLASPSSSSTTARFQQCGQERPREARCPPRRPSIHTEAVSAGSSGHGVFLARAAAGARRGVEPAAGSLSVASASSRLCVVGLVAAMGCTDSTSIRGWRHEQPPHLVPTAPRLLR